MRLLVSDALSVWLLRANDGDNSYWCLFWVFHTLNWAELSHSPDLGYFYSFCLTLKRVVRTTDGM